MSIKLGTTSIPGILVYNEGGGGGSSNEDVTSQITFTKGSNVDFHLYTDGTYVFGYGHMAMVDDGRDRGQLEITLPFYANIYHPIPGSSGVAYDSNVNQITMTYANGVLTNYLFMISGEVVS